MPSFLSFLSLKTKIILSLVGLLIVAVLVFSLIISVQNCKHQQQVESLQQQILERTDYAVTKIDDNTSAIQTLETKKTISKEEVADEIAKQIKKNKLDIVYDAQIRGTLDIKESIKGKSTKPTTIIEHNTETIVTDPAIEQQCNTCLAKTRIKVPFDVIQGPFHVVGHTLTPVVLGDPGDYVLDVSMVKELQMEITLTQNKKGEWQTFVYSEDFDASNVKSKISVKPFAIKWYEKFLFPATLSLSKQLHVNMTIGAYYKFIDHFAFGINAGLLFLNYKDSRYDWQLGIGVIATSGK